MSYAKLDLKFELPIWIQENEHSLTIVNPGGVVSEVSYEDEWLPFRYVEASNEAFGKKYKECGTGKPVIVKRQTFRTSSQFYGDERKIDSFVKNLILYEPYKIKQLGKEGKLRILCFDFEMFTDGKFPDAEKDPIIAYGVFRMDQSYEDPLNSNVRFKIDKKNEKALIESFLDEIISYDPDIVVGYFSTDFDLPYLYKRMKKLGIKLDILNRIQSDIEDDFGFFYAKDGSLILSKAGRSLGLGRIHDDIFLNSVKKDDFLRTKRVKNRRLKTVAAAYGLEGIYDLTENEKTNLGELGRDNLERYIISDLRCTAHLCSRYIGTTLSLSRMLVWPLDMTINRSSGKVADIFAGQRAFEQGWLSLRQSKFRFAKLFETITTSAKGKFEGAYNWASEPAIFPQISKTDVTSMYPSIMIQFNLSPDSLSLINVIDINNRDGVEPIGNLDPDLIIGYKQVQYNIDGKQVTRDWYSIPDRNMRKRLIIEVDRKPGFVVSFLTDLMSMRKEVKDNLKKAQNELEVASLDSKQNSIKILLNSIASYEEVNIYDTFAKQYININIETLYRKWIVEPLRYLAPAMGKDGYIKLSPISKIWRHPNAENYLFRIITKSNLSVDVTPQHSLMFFNRNDKLPHSKLSSDIIIGDLVAVSPGISETLSIDESAFVLRLHEIRKSIKDLLRNDNETTITVRLKKYYSLLLKGRNGKNLSIDILKQLHRKKWTNIKYSISLDRLRPTNLIEIRKINVGTVHYNQCRLTSKGHRFLKLIQNFNFYYDGNFRLYHTIVNCNKLFPLIPCYEEFFESIRITHSRHELKTKYTISKEEAYCIGAYLAEGSISKVGTNSYRGEITQKSGKVDKERLVRSLDSMFGNNHLLTTAGVNLTTWNEYLFFVSLTGKDSYSKCIHPLLKTKLRGKTLESLISGYYDGDGNSLGHNLRRFTTASFQLAVDIKLLLQNLGKMSMINYDGCYRISERSRPHLSKQEIKSIDKIPYTDYVYDICIPDGETFVMSNGLLSHNSCYGAMGNEHFYHTSLPIAIFVTAIGREITGYIHECFRADVVEIDTDGLIFKDTTINADIVNEKISNFLLKKYKKKECYIAVKDEYGTENRVSMLLSKKKNYCIYEDGEVEPVGNTFTSSRFPPFIGKIIKDTAKTLIQETINGNNCRDILDNIRINAINNLYSGSLDQFKLSLNIHKSMGDYKSLGKPSNRLSVFLSNERLSSEEKIEQIKDYFKETIVPNVTPQIANALSKMLNKLDPHKLEKTSTELVQYCVGTLDTKINSSMSQAVKVLDKYFEKHGSYPLVGESVEYYYCADSGEVDITENLKSITQIAISHYRKIIESVMNIFAETIQNRNNVKGSNEDGLFG
jgi:DNA polymerase elongation subunit (family B)